MYVYVYVSQSASVQSPVTKFVKTKKGKQGFHWLKGGPMCVLVCEYIHTYMSCVNIPGYVYARQVFIHIFTHKHTHSGAVGLV